ncbi:MAG: ABC transporter substrate-binding protein [Thermobacillus sp. ZCTH02-B1]|uniref:ABC transporter substrate-binding protein n=1 Tax=Thermobacillus sp. ZCTH02-B1 TaxID=1858795 RepID=UPI000B56715E|nr:extracellular solute-binding protein [Thermobacillus sp. ZCTH02-B1]OUM94164.1 MAG: ABC transporter substrate-binding protein [Thermobacillus sp. ZCTH02-B1]
MQTIMKRRGFSLLAFFMAVVLVLTACGGGKSDNRNAGNADSGANAGNSGGNSDAGAPTGSYLQQAYDGAFKGKVVTMYGPFVDADEMKFNESIKEFEEKTGIDIQYEGSKEFEATISVRVNGGNAPDIADFPQPGLLKNFVKEGKVIDVRTFLGEDYLKQQYAQSWLDMATMPGPNGEDVMAGIWARSSVKSLVWYNKKEFEAAGYKIPTTWDELLALTEQIAADGDPAWAIGIESGAATGWPATDWIEDIMLRTTSPENYDKWVNGELPFTDPIVRNAFEKMAEIWFNEDYVYGGRKSIVQTPFGDAVKLLFDNPPKAWLHRQAGFITSFFPEGLTEEDFDWFPFPSIDPQYGTPALISGDIYAMFNDRPEVRAVMEFFTTAESLKTWIQSGGVTPPMNGADPSWYANEAERKMADFLQSASTIRFDGSDLMPGSVGAGTFWKGVTDYVSGTATLDQALETIQSGWNQ